MSILIFGLTSDYRKEENRQQQMNNDIDQTQTHTSRLGILFIAIYAISIILAFFSVQYSQIFIPWQELGVKQVISSGFAIFLCCFGPGYAVISSLDKKNELRTVPRFLLSYIISVLITGLVGYISGSIGIAGSNINIILAAVNLIIIGQFLAFRLFPFSNGLTYLYPEIHFSRIRQLIILNVSELIVFSSIFAIVIVSTYMMYDGTIIGDQWDHHGRSLIFLSGVFKFYSDFSMLTPYPPFLFAFLAAFFSVSHLPTVNSYVAIDFLNIMPVIAFYYFFTAWFPTHRKAALLGSALFMLSSGFGWAYVFHLDQTSPITSPESAINNLFNAGVKTFDIWLPTNFIDVGHPDITTGLIIMALPAGFVMLGLVKERIGSKFVYGTIISAVSFLGIISHDEFGLFLIITPLLPLIFRITGKRPVYVAVLLALSVIIINSLFPTGQDYRARGIDGVPFIILYFVFAILLYALYESRILDRFKTPEVLSKLSKLLSNKRRVRFVLCVSIVSAVCYFYVLSFIIWNIQNPAFDVRLNTNGQHVVPLYFYPLRLGITGLVGLAFVLSYLFKKFEKEVFVFGIIVIIAVLTGPYYDEHRFSKYIMAAMAGLASLFIYRILSGIQTPTLKISLINGIILGLIVTSSSLSVLMYEGYSALGVQNSNKNFDNSLPARHFPSDTDLQFLDFLRNNLNLRVDNLAMPEQTLGHPYQGLGRLIESFVGLPVSKITQSTSTLQGTSIEDFYKLLRYTNAKFIIIPKDYGQTNGLSDVLYFAYLHFQKAYEDNNYWVFSVPSMEPPTSGANITLVSHRSLEDYDISNVWNKTLMYTTTNFNVPILKDIHSIVLSGDERVFSKPLEENVNYIKAVFRVTGENGTDNHSGLIWNDGKKTYYALVRPNSISLYDPQDGEFGSFPIKREAGEWSTLEVVYFPTQINIFLNSELKIQIPRSSTSGSIIEVGTRVHNNVAQFEPLVIGMIKSPPTLQYNNFYYYTLSAFALSKSQYDIAPNNEFSTTSKTIVLPFDPSNDSKNVYLPFVKNGGTVVVVNTDQDFKDRIFSNLLCISSDAKTPFNGITSASGSRQIIINGTAMNLRVSCPGLIMDSFYTNNNQHISPFAVEKQVGKGKVIFVNAFGYYDAIRNSTMKDFPTLGQMPGIIGLNTAKVNNPVASTNAIPTTRFEGEANMSGSISVRSSSILFPENYEFYAKNIIFKNHTNISNLSKEAFFGNARVRGISIQGPSAVIGYLDHLSYVPSQLSSPYGYFGLDLPNGSNLDIRLFNGSSATLLIGNGSSMNITGGDIELVSIRSALPDVSHVPILMKEPELSIAGQLHFRELRSNNPHNPTRPWANAVPISIDGRSIIKLDYVSNDVDNSSRYITYFHWLRIDSNTDNPVLKSRASLLLPIPMVEAMNSSAGTKLLIVILVSAGVAVFFGLSRLTLQVKK
ncbi:MAG: hypothetical protein M3P08_14110 [Thermoproteota archaeon]|nr:hypothetical protein [Thermoproteota archaeon]